MDCRVEGTVGIKIKQGCINDFILVCEIDKLVDSNFLISDSYESKISVIWIKSIIPI